LNISEKVFQDLPSRGMSVEYLRVMKGDKG